VTFPATLHALRLRAELSVAELAVRTGLSRTAIYNLENGEDRPTWETVQKLAAALSVSTDTFRDAIPEPA